jgi:hypothetical protein
MVSGARVQRIAAGVGAVGLLLCLLGAWIDPRQAAFAYLAAFACWLSLALGALIMVMIAHCTGASWFVMMRRVTESIASTLPLFALLFIPILFALRELYPWARPLAALSDEMREAVVAKAGYFSISFFVVRAVIYFAIWIGVSYFLHAWSVERDRTPDPELVRRQRVLAAVGLPPVAFALTFASFDWVMSLAPQWISTMFGVYFFAGGIVAALGLVAVLDLALERSGVLAGEITPSHYHALGKLLLTFVIFWGYVAYSQYFIIWIADVPAEAGWYAPRVRGTWGLVAAALALGFFAIPFLALLSWRLKRRGVSLAAVGGWLVVFHCVDAYWLVLPALHPRGVSIHWLDFAAFAGSGGAALAFGSWRFLAHAPTPLDDPLREVGLEFTTR